MVRICGPIESWEKTSLLSSLPSIDTSQSLWGLLTDKEVDISVFLRLCVVQLSVKIYRLVYLFSITFPSPVPSRLPIGLPPPPPHTHTVTPSLVAPHETMRVRRHVCKRTIGREVGSDIVVASQRRPSSVGYVHEPVSRVSGVRFYAQHASRVYVMYVSPRCWRAYVPAWLRA